MKTTPSYMIDLKGKSRPSFDAVSFLTIYMVLLCAIPSYLSLPVLGSLGKPSVLWGLLGIAWWLYFRLQLVTKLTVGSNWVKIAAFLFICSVLLTFAITNLVGQPTHLTTTSQSSLLRALSWTGVMLVAIDGIPDRQRLLTLLQRTVLVGALMALLGLTQFLTKQPIIDVLVFPGFVADDNLGAIYDRGGFIRSSATAAHPLEYGAVLCFTLPLAFVLAHIDLRRGALRRWLPVALIGFAAAISMSRSAMIGIALGIVLVIPVIPAHLRMRAMLGAIGLGAFVVFTLPGMLGTIRGLFMGISAEPSSVSRIDSFGEALVIALHRPFFGQGLSALGPTEIILDNQFLLLLVELGFIGVATFAFLIFTAMSTGWILARKNRDSFWRGIGPAVSASIASGASTFLFFDGLSFAIAAGFIFLFLGIAGSMARICTSSRDDHADPLEQDAPDAGTRRELRRLR